MPFPGAELVSRFVSGLTSKAAAEFQPTLIEPSGKEFALDADPKIGDADDADTFEKRIERLREKIQEADEADLVGIADVIRDVNHSAQAPCGTPPTSDTVQFCWNDEDNEGTTWIPQGLTASWDAHADGTYAGHRIIAASWHDDKGRDGTDRGCRVTFINYDDPEKPKYRHALLVVPDGDGSFQAMPADSHAGGIAWVGDKLYVADTQELRVFDLNNIWRAQPDSSHKKIGMYDGKVYAADYRYAIPQSRCYEPKQPLRFSCVSLDRTRTPNSLIIAEYKKDRAGVHSTKNADAEIVRWDLGDDGWLVESSENEALASGAWVTTRANINGAITHGDAAEPEFVLTTSEFDRKPAWVHRAKIGSSERYTRVPAGGIEDLTYEPQSKRMWTLTEYNGRRTVFGIPLSSIGKRSSSNTAT
ncbi:hypothetical protein [Actinomadura sp. 9N407]|uniref:hypothetical protein n=1 Tax=Actinomadura sp. 9N407 TaxID=3375154 RepID=UPI0037B15FDA